MPSVDSLFRSAACPRRALLRTRRVTLLALAWVSAAGCHPDGEANTRSAVPHPLERGDRVVIEARAAEFFEGRVLATAKEKLRIEPLGKNESIVVSPADAYRLPAAVPSVKPDELAICRVASGWLGCRVVGALEHGFDVETIDGARLRITDDALLSASAVTELNLKRAFARSAREREFRLDAARAGTPLAPAGFHVAERARVLARRANGWYSGTVERVRAERAYVAFAPDGVSEAVTLSDVVPEPPYPTLPARGGFALVRPASPSDPWETMRVIGPSERDFRVSSADAVARVVSSRDLVPLANP